MHGRRSRHATRQRSSGHYNDDMAHGESLEKEKGKHGSWMEKMKTGLGLAGLGTLGANYLLAAAACVTFPPYILAGATLASAYYFYDSKAAKGKSRGRH